MHVKKIFHFLICNGLKWDSKEKINNIISYIDKKDKIIDIGSGSGIISFELKKKGFDIVSMDIKDVSIRETPLIYNGDKIPFDDKKFTISLLLTVLHHTKNTENLLKEAKRVSNKIIIVEDIYNNFIQKHLTFKVDSLFNLEFNNPHNNKTDKEWKKTFKKLDLKLIDIKHIRFLMLFRQAIYYLES